jgi:hypothetical protein
VCIGTAASPLGRRVPGPSACVFRAVASPMLALGVGVGYSRAHRHPARGLTNPSRLA